MWRAGLGLESSVLHELGELLSVEERERAARFLRKEHGQRFVAAHGRLRQVLSRYLDLEARALAFESNEHGKPALACDAPDADLAFNLSHSGDVALIAVTRGAAVGIDVERHRERLELDKIARRYFSPGEVERLFALGEAEQPAAFYRCWANKEAYVKARGEGIAMGLDRFEVAFCPGESPGLLHSSEGAAERERWSFFALDAGPAYAAACVVEGDVGPPLCWSAD